MSEISQLRRILFDTLDEVKSGKIDAKTADAVSKLSQNIIQSVVLEIRAAELTGSRIEALTPQETEAQRRARTGGIIHQIR